MYEPLPPTTLAQLDQSERSLVNELDRLATDLDRVGTTHLDRAMDRLERSGIAACERLEANRECALHTLALVRSRLDRVTAALRGLAETPAAPEASAAQAAPQAEVAAPARIAEAVLAAVNGYAHADEAVDCPTCGCCHEPGRSCANCVVCEHKHRDPRGYTNADGQWVHTWRCRACGHTAPIASPDDEFDLVDSRTVPRTAPTDEFVRLICPTCLEVRTVLAHVPVAYCQACAIGGHDVAMVPTEEEEPAPLVSASVACSPDELTATYQPGQMVEVLSLPAEVPAHGEWRRAVYLTGVPGNHRVETSDGIQGGFPDHQIRPAPLTAAEAREKVEGPKRAARSKAKRRKDAGT